MPISGMPLLFRRCGSATLVDHKGRGAVEEFAEHGGYLGVELRRLERAVHQTDPAIAPALINSERHVPHPQARMTTLFDVALRPAKAADQEVAQPLLGASQVVLRIHGAKNLVGRYLCVEGTNEAAEAFLANARVHINFCHNSSMSEDAPKSALELAMERLKKKDAAEGIAELTLTDEQREEIAEIKRVYAAKIAEEEILYTSKIMTIWEPEERAKLDEGHRREVARLNEDRDKKTAKVREKS